jgi:hypothetical protein
MLKPLYTKTTLFGYIYIYIYIKGLAVIIITASAYPTTFDRTVLVGLVEKSQLSTHTITRLVNEGY